MTEDADYKEYVQSKQLYRSGTSIGANIRESKHAQSDADLLSKMSIVYKEADESDFWLNLFYMIMDIWMICSLILCHKTVKGF